MHLPSRAFLYGCFGVVGSPRRYVQGDRASLVAREMLEGFRGSRLGLSRGLKA